METVELVFVVKMKQPDQIGPGSYSMTAWAREIAWHLDSIVNTSHMLGIQDLKKGIESTEYSVILKVV